MNAEKLSEVTGTIRDVLREFDIDFDMFTVSTRVTKEVNDQS